MNAHSHVPYCGIPPIPGHLTWNLDPVLIAILVAAPILYAVGAQRQSPDRQRRFCFYIGWAILAAALVSPLCNLSVALFSARVAQHMLLTLVAAPLIVLGQPGRMLLPMLPKRASLHLPQVCGALSIAATAGFAVALWTWHLPGSYDATLRSDVVYWSMHVTTLGTALLLWHALFDRFGGLLSALLIGFGTTVQMSLLSALLTSAPRPLFVSHFGTTWPWGLSPLEDQQLGGVIMWTVGGTLFTAIGVLVFGAWLKSLATDGAPGQAARAP
jgi:putative membrane protein